MTDEGRDRSLTSEASQAARSPAAVHDDALSPAQALRESINASGSQRVGDSPPVANPLVSFPEPRSDDEPPGTDVSACPAP